MSESTQTEHNNYLALSEIFKRKDTWKESISYVAGFLSSSEKLQAKSLWILGETGLCFPKEISEYVPLIADFLNSGNSLLRSRAVNALGRIGRADFKLIEPYWDKFLSCAHDNNAKVRLSFIWASENIATNSPDLFSSLMPSFESFLYDDDEKVRMESPEIFRVVGKRQPLYVFPFIDTLNRVAENDKNRVVRIHAKGAIKAIKLKS